MQIILTQNKFFKDFEVKIKLVEYHDLHIQGRYVMVR